MKKTELKPGYDLDLLISKEIYGIKFPTHKEIMAAINERRKKINWIRAEDKYWSRTGTSMPWGFYFWKNRNGKIDYKLELANVSRDLEAAFQLVNFMRKDGFYFRMSQSNALPDGLVDVTRVSFVCSNGPCKRHQWNRSHNHHGAYDVEADSIEMAICKAALIAKKVIDAK